MSHSNSEDAEEEELILRKEGKELPRFLTRYTGTTMHKGFMGKIKRERGLMSD